jgi:glycosyltransferase involved in cell wall biosynthesis
MNKNVLFVDEDPGRTGSTVSLEYLIKRFKSDGFKVYVLTSKKKKKYRSILEQYAILINARKWRVNNLGLNLYFNNLTSPLSFKGLWTLIKEAVKVVLGIVIVWRAAKESEADLIYSNEYVVVQGYIAAKFLGIPAAVHIRSRFLKGKFGLRRLLLSRLLTTCNQAIFAISKVEAEQIQARKEERKRISTIGEFFPTGDAALYNKTICRRKFAFSKSKKVVLMLGGILDMKGTLDFLNAAQRIIDKRENVLFVIAGRTYKSENAERKIYFDKCMTVIKALEKRKAIRMLGEINNPLELIAASDIVVSPSTQTHFSRPVIEAWGFAKPVIATNTKHMKNLITNGINGLLFEVGDDDAFAHCICRLLNDDELCKKLGKNGKKETNTKFNAEKNIQTILKVCKSLIST